MEKQRYFKKLNGRKVYLSPMNPEDYPIYAKWINDLEISRGLGNSTANYSLPKEKEVVEKIASEGHNYAIVNAKDDSLLGNCSLFDIDQTHNKAELGIFIGDKENHNKGYGKEAVLLMLSYGFKVLNLNNIILKVYSFNENAISAYARCGFKEIGRRHESYLMNGKYYDDVYMEILRKDFQSDYLNSQLP